MSNEVQSNENLFYSDLKTRLQRDRRHERLYIRLTKNEKERLRQFAGKVGMPLGEFVLNISLVYNIDTILSQRGYSEPEDSIKLC